MNSMCEHGRPDGVKCPVCGWVKPLPLAGHTAFQMSLEIIRRIVVESGNYQPVKTILDDYDLKDLVPFFSSNPLPLNTEHATFQADHPQVTTDGTEIWVRNRDLDHDIMFLSPAEAIALGYALFSLGLHLKGK